MKPSERRRAKIEAIRREKQAAETNEAMAAVVADMYWTPTKGEWLAIVLVCAVIAGFIACIAI